MSKAKKAEAEPGGKRSIVCRLAAPDYVLALDVSLAHTGYARADLATGEITKGLVEPVDVNGMPRLAFLRDQLLKLAEPTHRTLVLIEGYAYAAKGQAVISLGELGGVLRLALYEAAIPVIEISPAQVKKFTTGKGNAPKNIMLKEVFKRFNVDIDDDNIADAFALVQLGCALVDRPLQPNGLVKFQEEVVVDVLKTYWKSRPPAAAKVAA
jgi:crossover junction endodeoxyribonuclease RuvC